MTFAIVVFFAALAVIASERIHRTHVALLGAALVVVGGSIAQEAAIEAVDFNTIGLLAGMMILVHVIEGTGVFDYLAIRAAQFSRGKPGLIVASLAVNTAILSAFLDNLTTVLLVVPVTFTLARTLDIDPIPLVIIEVVASNIGGTATLIGDPPNIMIAGATGLSFNEFILNLAPIAIVTFAVVTYLLFLFYRRRLHVDGEVRLKMMELSPRAAILEPDELRRTLPVLVLTIVGFFFHKALGLEPATVALTGAAVVLMLTKHSIETALSKIQWSVLFFFMGLFVMVGALEQTGFIAQVADGMSDLFAGDRTAEILGIAWLGALGSGLVDNIPFTAAMIPVVAELQEAAGAGGDNAYWWALALGTCFGGNMTIIAAAANVAAAGIAEQNGRPIGFLPFLRIGVPVTLISMAMASGYLLLRYLS